MEFRLKAALVMSLALLLFAFANPSHAQQKGLWVPGQAGLNAGVVPDPGFTYMNMAINYSASQLNDPSGNYVPGVSGTYSFWVDENIFMYVPKFKILGGYFAPYVDVNWASGDLNADIIGLNLNGGGSGLADTYVVPLNLGWHFRRADINTAYSFFAPTGRYTPGATNNVGSGYWGNNWVTGTTVYLTKNKGTSANLLTAWEFHGSKNGAAGTTITPGQTFTAEWGLGQVLPLSKDMHKLLQVGAVGYDQWQVSHNGGTLPLPGGVTLPASLVPFYSVHAAGVQTNFILPVTGLNFFFKYYDEYAAKSRPEGRTFVFGTAYTLRTSKPKPEAPNVVTPSCAVSGSPVMQNSNQPAAVSASASNTRNLPMNYTWTATGGKVDGTGPEVRWDSTGVAPGTYTVTAKVDDGHGVSASCSSDVTVNPIPQPTMSCSADRSQVMAGERSTITAVANDQSNSTLNYQWQTNGGQIVGSGNSVQLDTSGLQAGDYAVTGRVANGAGGAADCNVTVTVQAPPPPPQASKIGSCNFKENSSKVDNVCKRVLDDAAVRLQNDPKASVVLVGYADSAEKSPDTLAKSRGDNSVQYLTSSKGVDASRATSQKNTGTAGAGQDNYRIDLYYVPDGATFTPPQP
jgi:outer membrane protein OmpA-like peptidoglycan-associated protein